MDLKIVFAYLLTVILCCGAVSAQNNAKPEPKVLGGAAKEKAAPADAEGKEAAAAEAPTAYKLEGDTITLKSGKILRGVKVLRVSPSIVEVEYIPGQPVMKISQKQIARIEYADQSKAAQAGTASGAPDKGQPDVMFAEELSAEFHRKLTAPIPNTPAEFKDADALEVLKDLTGRAQVQLTIDEQAAALPEAQRKITITVPEGATLAAFLRNEFMQAAQAIKISYQFEKVVALSVEAEARKAAGSLPPGLAPKNGTVK